MYVCLSDSISSIPVLRSPTLLFIIIIIIIVQEWDSGSQLKRTRRAKVAPDCFLDCPTSRRWAWSPPTEPLRPQWCWLVRDNDSTVGYGHHHAWRSPHTHTHSLSIIGDNSRGFLSRAFRAVCAPGKHTLLKAKCTVSLWQALPSLSINVVLCCATGCQMQWDGLYDMDHTDVQSRTKFLRKVEDTYRDF